MSQITEEIAARASAGTAKVANNGLDSHENKALIASTDPQYIAGLVLTSLSRL